MKQQRSRFLKRLLSYFPSQLPVGMTAYNAWSDSVVELIGPIATKDDLDFCIAAEVMRLGPSANTISKNYVVKRVRAGAAKQIAGAKFTEIKQKQQEAQRAAQAAALKQAEATGASSEPVASEKV